MDPRVTIRSDLRPGDLGWVIGRHGTVYATEFGWNREFEVLVSGIATAFFASHDPAWERAWFAELDGRLAGCVFLVRVSDELAKLRMLLVDLDARGYGIGRELTHRCIAHARALGYQRMTLWTNSVLEDARRLYAREGFVLVASEPIHEFGVDLTSETWELDLCPVHAN